MTMKDDYTDLYYEIYALMSVEFAFPGYSKNMRKGESPDWHNNAESVGLEVTRADNKHTGYTKKFFNTYLGKNRKEIPPKKIDGFQGALFYNADDKLYAGSVGLVYGCRHIRFAVSSLEKKLKLMNGEKFSRFTKNDIYIFVISSILDCDISMFLEKCRYIERAFQYSFSRIFLFDNGSLYSISTVDSSTEMHEFCGEDLKTFKREAKSLARQQWADGTPFNLT